MGRAIDVDNRLQSLEKRLESVESQRGVILDSVNKTEEKAVKVEHIDLTEIDKEKTETKNEKKKQKANVKGNANSNRKSNNGKSVSKKKTS